MEHLWSPGFWKILDGKYNLQHCIFKTQAPWLNPKLRLSVVQLIGIGTILNNTRILSMGSRWPILKNNSKWKPISLSDCENHKGEWLFVPSVYEILNSPNPGLSHLLQ